MKIHVIHVLVVKLIAAARIGEKEVHLSIIDVIGDITLDVGFAVTTPIVKLKPPQVT